MKQDNSNEILNDVTTNDYKYGFVTDIETDIIPTGLNVCRYGQLFGKNWPNWVSFSARSARR